MLNPQILQYLVSLGIVDPEQIEAYMDAFMQANQDLNPHQAQALLQFRAERAAPEPEMNPHEAEALQRFRARSMASSPMNLAQRGALARHRQPDLNAHEAEALERFRAQREEERMWNRDRITPRQAHRMQR